MALLEGVTPNVTKMWPHYLYILQVSNIRLPTHKGRMKGYGYAEFEDRQSLVDALTLNDTVSWGSLVSLAAEIYILILA